HVTGVQTCALPILQRTSRRADFAALARLVESEAVVAVVCGLPLNMDGSEGDQARTTRNWAERLAHALRTLLGRPLPVILWDERLSTFTARQPLFGQDQDSAAAAVI